MHMPGLSTAKPVLFRSNEGRGRVGWRVILHSFRSDECRAGVSQEQGGIF
jgi:hypothetical protein